MLNRLLRQHPDVLLVLLLCISASWSFWARPSLPRETDLELHVFRTAEWAYSAREGNIYPRWAPDFYYGYGYPIFNYYAPLTYIAANVLSLANPNWAVTGVKLVIILTFFGAGIGVWGTAKSLTDSRGGVIAAASYLFAPYIYLIDPHLRGAIAEFLALGIGPLALWLIQRYMTKPTALRLTAASVTIAALIMSHNLLGLILFVLFVGWMIWVRLTHAEQSIMAWLRVILPFALAVMLAAFFWLPVALEQDAVQLSNLVGDGNFDFRNHFIPINELFAPIQRLDLGATNPAFRLNLGVAQVALGTLGILGAVSAQSQRQSKQAVFWVTSSLLTIALMLPVSLPVWEAIPQAAFVQFPWRLLGPAALTLAIGAAYATNLLRHIQTAYHPWLVASAILLPGVFALPAFVPPDWSSFGETNRNAILDFELSGVALGTTSTGDYLPRGVSAVPAPDPNLINALRSDAEVDRIWREPLPEATDVRLIEDKPRAQTYEVSSPQAFDLQIQSFMYDGWQAEINGQAVGIDTAQPSGFISIPVPAGDHEVTLAFRSTPARQLALGISVLGLILMTSTYFLPLFSVSYATQNATSWDSWSLVSQMVGLGFVIISVLATLGVFQFRSQGTVALPAQADTHEFVQGGIDLIGYDLPSTALVPGETYEITLYWKAREPIPDNYQVFLHLNTSPFQTWVQSDKLNPGDYPTTRWPLDKYVRDVHQFVVPEGTPPGEYEVRVGLWNFMTGIRQLVLDEEATVLGDTILVGVVEVERATASASDAELSIETVINEDFGSLTLIGVNRTPSETINQGSGLLVMTLFWEATDLVDADYRVGIRVRESRESEPVYEVIGAPAGGQLEFSAWQEGEVFRDVHAIRFDESLASGSYIVEVALIDPATTTDVRWLEVDQFEREITP